MKELNETNVAQEEDTLDETEELCEFASKVLNDYVNVAATPSQTSTYVKYDPIVKTEITHCVYCGKELVGHFEGGAYITNCDCEEAVKEHNKLMRIKELDSEIKKVTKERDELFEKLKNNSWKHAAPFIIKERNETTERISKAFKAFENKH